MFSSSNFFILLTVMSCADAVVQLVPEAYFKIPYNAAGSTYPFRNTAIRMAWDPVNEFLYVIGDYNWDNNNDRDGFVNIVDVRNKSDIKVAHFHLFSNANDGIPTDIAFCRSGATERVAITFKSKHRGVEGHLQIWKPYTRFDRTFVLERTASPVGIEPVAVVANPTCNFFVVASQATPSLVAEVFEDKEPEIEIIELTSDGTSTIKVSLDTAVNLDETHLRYSFKHPNGNIRTQLEPLRMTMDEEQNVYISFPVNNAVASFNLPLYADPATRGDNPLKFHDQTHKYWANYYIDASDVEEAGFRINMSSRNIYSFLQSETLGSLRWAVDNKTYLVTTHTGAFRTYTSARNGIDFQEGIRGALFEEDRLDNTAVPVSEMKQNIILGRMYFSNNEIASDGWDSIYHKFRKIYAFGGRSFGISTTENGGINLVWESGNKLASAVANGRPEVFNGDCSNPSMAPSSEFDRRSPHMGVEAKSLALTVYKGEQLAIIGSGRMGGLWVYRFEPNFDGTIYAVEESFIRPGRVDDSWLGLYNNADPLDIGLGRIVQLLMIENPNDDADRTVVALCEGLGVIEFFKLSTTTA